jgi:hypothetical protein
MVWGKAKVILQYLLVLCFAGWRSEAAVPSAQILLEVCEVWAFAAFVKVKNKENKRRKK